MASGKIVRVRVDSERCQGHNRCCAIAPELFEADELGNARVKGDGTVRAGAGGQGAARRGQLPGARGEARP